MSIAAMVAVAPLRHGMKSDAVRAVQCALQAAGAQLVPDGAFGDITEAAVRRFQAAHGLKVDGQVGPLTGAALDQVADHATAAPAPVPEPALASVQAAAPWLSVMRAITGTRELPGAEDSPIILHWREEIVAAFPECRAGVAGYTHDSIPWCGFGEAYTLAKSGHRPPLEPLWALNFAQAWPDAIRLEEPTPGAILVYERNGGGHVTTYEGEDADYLFGRGCNQSDMVNVARFPKSRRPVAVMWPKSAGRPSTGRRRMSFDAAVSVRES